MKVYKLWLVANGVLCTVALSATAQHKKVPVKQIKHAPVKIIPMAGSADSASYALGYMVAQDMAGNGFTAINYRLLQQAMEDFFAKRAGRLTPAQGQAALRNVAEETKRRDNMAYIQQQKQFLLTNARDTGVKALPSGLQYKVIKQSNGPRPLPGDEVTVHYRGRLTNGKEFDSSYERNEPFTTRLTGVIKGWQQGIPLVPKGAVYRLFIPAELAYGSRKMGEDIPAFSTLVFDVEVLAINGK